MAMTGNLLKMAKEAMEMRKQMKKVQAELAAMTVEYNNGGVKVVFQCDMAMKSLSIEPDIIDITRVDKLERTLFENINKAIKLAQGKAAEHMKGNIKDMDFGKMLDGE